MTEVQHTLSVRIGKQIVKINCPPYASILDLERYLSVIKYNHPDWVVVSKSWTVPNAAA